MSKATHQLVCLTRAGGRRYLIGPASAFPIRRDTVRKPSSSIIRAIANDSSEVHRLPLQLGHSQNNTRYDIESWLTTQVEQRKLIILEIDEHYHRATKKSQQTRKLSATKIAGGGAKELRSGTDIKSWSAISKIYEMVLQSIAYLPKELRQDMNDYITPEALFTFAGTLATWAVGHFFGYGEAIDVCLLVVGYGLIGFSALQGVKDLFEGVDLAYAARDQKQIDSAAQIFARGVTRLGIDTILLFLAKKFSASAAAEREANAIARWRSYISHLDFRFDGSRAALWTRLGDKGARAAALAKTEGLTTLETVLEKTNFNQRYGVEFGNKENAVTYSIWQMISEEYASKLSGSVTVYMDQIELMNPKKGMPQLGAELLEILDRPNVTDVVFKDVNNPSNSLVWSRADMARFRGDAPRSGVWN